MSKIFSALYSLAWVKEPTSVSVACQLIQNRAKDQIVFVKLVESEILASERLAESERLIARIFASKRLTSEREHAEKVKVQHQRSEFVLLKEPNALDVSESNARFHRSWKKLI